MSETPIKKTPSTATVHLSGNALLTGTVAININCEAETEVILEKLHGDAVRFALVDRNGYAVIPYEQWFGKTLSSGSHELMAFAATSTPVAFQVDIRYTPDKE